MKLVVTEHKVREYTELDSVPWNELPISRAISRACFPVLYSNSKNLGSQFH